MSGSASGRTKKVSKAEAAKKRNEARWNKPPKLAPIHGEGADVPEQMDVDGKRNPVISVKPYKWTESMF